MIRFEPVPEPEDFHEKVRQPGLDWLANHPAPKRPKYYWTKGAMPALRSAFRNLCAYSVMETIPGTVDHFLSCKNARELAYEWSNYRYCQERINSYKSTLDDQLLDPFEVGDDWFEILLPSMQLVPTDTIPAESRDRAIFTLQKLKLIAGKEDNWIIRLRQSWYKRYCEKKISLELLDEYAPMIARAIRKHEAAQSEPRSDS